MTGETQQRIEDALLKSLDETKCAKAKISDLVALFADEPDGLSNANEALLQLDKEGHVVMDEPFEGEVRRRYGVFRFKAPSTYERCVDSKDYNADPGFATQLAKDEGPVAVLKDGRVVMMLSVPNIEECTCPCTCGRR